MRWISIGVLAFCLSPLRAFAYAEYAARYNINSCTACHFSPSGGGPRNIDGKLFGAHGYAMNPWLVQEYVSADVRALYYSPQRASAARGGMGIMSGSVAGHVNLDPEHRIQLVVQQNIAGFSVAPYQDTYALFRLHEEGHPAWFDSVMVGRFRIPFGIVTDEHRTYVRIQSETSYNDYETGAMLSGSPSDQWHYDVFLANGRKSNGSNLTEGQATQFGGGLNLRYLPGPVMFGSSFTYHDRGKTSPTAEAASLYSIASLGRWTNDRVPVYIQLEYSQAWGWDSGLAQGFVNDAQYATSLSRSASQGGLALMEWALSQRFSLIYKFDYLVPDRNYPADYYQRHGVGFRWVVGPNVIVQARTELARATHPSEQGSLSEGGQNATYAVLQLAL